MPLFPVVESINYNYKHNVLENYLLPGYKYNYKNYSLASYLRTNCVDSVYKNLTLVMLCCVSPTKSRYEIRLASSCQDQRTAKGPVGRGHIKNRQKVAQRVKTNFDNFLRSAKKVKNCRKVSTKILKSRRFSTILERRQCSGPVWGALARVRNGLPTFHMNTSILKLQESVSPRSPCNPQ